MNRPYIICHMVTSIDGKVTGDFLSRPASAKACEIYYDINRNLKSNGVLVMNYKNSYDNEVKQRFGNTDAYKEHAEKTANYTVDKWQEVNDDLMSVFAKFAECMQNGNSADSDKAQALVIELQDYITENYYTCTNEILAGLGLMYIADERFKNNIDKNSVGTAEFVSKAIKVFCSK